MGRAGKVSTRERERFWSFGWWWWWFSTYESRVRRGHPARAHETGQVPLPVEVPVGFERARERKRLSSIERRERERERERESASVLGLLLVAQPSPVAAAAPGARERTKQTTYHVVKTLAICANKKERSAATRGLGARATSTRLMMWPGGSSSANRSANRGQQKPTRLRAVP